ncbi:granulocyte colony-stimulating factor receptor [Dromaius novaehollandiae]|uniref:granulocyte colony-stimulating factor receptor n=1 Tax=Dromaius novaehollandiae TaxID=8790 RepID=UPI00311F1C6D
MGRRGAGTTLLRRLSLLLLLSLGGTHGCASVAVGSPVVPLGSAVTASCTVRSQLCGGLDRGRVRISWLLDGEPLAGRQRGGPGGAEVSHVTVPHFNRSQARLWCLLEWNGTRQRVGVAEIQAGYPPAKPSNLSCMLNLSDYGLTCQWERAADSLPTAVALQCATSRAQREPAGQAVTGCTPRAGGRRCTVPRRLLQLYRQMDFWVSARNALGTAESERLRIDPMDVAKLDPPTLQSIGSVPQQPDCVSVAWEAAPSSRHMELQCELRYSSAEDPAWALVPGIGSQAGPTQHCGFLCGTRYRFQMRCRRPSPGGYWSEWSAGRDFTTREKAPTARLDAWWSTRPVGAGRRVEVQLRWKAPPQREANGRLLGYRVALSPRRRGWDPPAVCDTADTQCNFSAPAGTGRVYLSAYNAAGESPATEVVLLERTGRPLAGLRAVPGGERSLWVHWEVPPAPAAGYVLEWYPTSAEPAGCSACWQRERDGGTTRALIRDGIEPFQQYSVLVYPLYKDAVGVPACTAAYSQQKAPSHAPKLHLKSISKSHAELCWDSIPVGMRNGFITNYTIFWANSTADVSSAVVNSSLSSFVIWGLKPSTLYKVHIMASTVAGSTNGTSLTLVTMVLDDIEIQFLFLTLGLVFVLLILLMICFQKNGRVKKQFWPSVPDPANSSLGKWVPAELQQEPLQIPGAREPGLATISTVTVLERGAGKQPWGKDPMAETTSGFPDLPKTYVQQDGPDTPSGSRDMSETSQGCYRNGGEPVQYAHVVGDGYKGQQHVPSRLYLRSSSTQPLLFDGTPSPTPYENLWFHGVAPERLYGQGGKGDKGFPEEPLINFPLLQGLKIGGAEELYDFQRF